MPNVVTEAAKEQGVSYDRVRLAIASAAMREGKKVHRWEDCVPIAAAAGKVNADELMKKAKSPEIEKKARATTAEFHALQVSHRPTFVVESDIGDKAVLSGTWKAAPLIEAIEAMLEDAAAYKSWAAHIGSVPQK